MEVPTARLASATRSSVRRVDCRLGMVIGGGKVRKDGDRPVR